MKPVTVKIESQDIVYDADALPTVEPSWFDAAHWRDQGVLDGSAPGRGTAWFLDAPFGHAVLRRYLRGGWVANVTQDQYWGQQASNSRPFREFHLLARMNEDGLPVPAPLAALFQGEGLFYRGALLTRRIDNTSALPDRFQDKRLDWSCIGKTIRRFHDSGVDHADLNARNIMIENGSSRTWLLDFDRSSYDPSKSVNGRGNLARFKRSLNKLWPQDDGSIEACWDNLMNGYGA